MLIWCRENPGYTLIALALICELLRSVFKYVAIMIRGYRPKRKRKKEISEAEEKQEL